MKTTFIAIFLCTAAPFAAGQAAQGKAAQPLPNMQAIAEALGVTCEYCHSAARGSGDPEPRKDIARQMLAMTRELNARVEAATAKPTGQAVRVDCITCHRGVPIPRQLSDIMWQTTMQQGGAAAVAQYRDLRTRFHGRASYDFGENTLIAVSQRIANAKPDDAIALMKLNLEFFPNSSASWAALAFAYTRKVDDASAIAALEKAVQLDPGNNVARGQLEQLKSYQRRK